jgi:hypothetical protein
METKLSARRQHYMERVSIFLMMVTLAAGIMGCGSTSVPPTGGPILYALDISSTAGGSVTVTVNGTETVIGPGEAQVIPDILKGAQVDVAASPNEGYEFMDWAGAPIDGVTNPVTTINIQDNYEITANFEAIPPTYQLTVAVSPPGSGTSTDETNAGPYTEGTGVSIEATANQGYHFVNWTAPAGVFDNATEAETTFTMPAQNVTVTANFAVDPMVAAGQYHTVGLESDGTVVAVGLNTSEQCNVGSWQNTIEVAAGGYHTVGLNSDGTVVAIGDNSYGQCSVGNWTDITQVAAGYSYTVGLKSDGTVVAVGDNSYAQCNVGSWTDIIQVATGHRHTVGLKSDGTVVAVGDDYFGQCDVSGWTNIIQVAAGGYHTVGLRSDDTVVAVGWNDFGQCGVTGWTDIIQVTAGYYHTVGLKSDDTVVAVGLNNCGQCNVSGWTDIVQVAGGYYHTVGFKSDGTVVAVGLNTDGQCNVGTWNLN